MTQQTPTCPGCENPLTQGQQHNVCFSEDCRYRYWLESKEIDVTNEDKGTCLFLMLNPSTADQDCPDNTVTKCKGFAQQWRYKTLWICNLFGYRSPDPADLKRQTNPVGPDNDQHIKAAASQADKIVLAWGDSGITALGKSEFNERVREVVPLLKEAGAYEKLYKLCPSGRLCLTQKGQPRHPQGRGKHSLPLDTLLVQFTDEELRRLQGL